MSKLPQPVAAYLNKHYPDVNMVSVNTRRDNSGHTLYKVVINQEEMVHHLTFSENGQLLNADTEPLYDEDYYEGGFYGNDNK